LADQHVEARVANDPRNRRRFEFQWPNVSAGASTHQEETAARQKHRRG